MSECRFCGSPYSNQCWDPAGTVGLPVACASQAAPEPQTCQCRKHARCAYCLGILKES